VPGPEIDLLRVKAERLQRLVDKLPALIGFWDQDLKNVISNQAYVDWFGMTPERIKGIHIREVLGEEVYALNLRYIQGALAGEEQHFDRSLVDPQGRVRHSHTSYVPEVVDGEVRGFFVLVTDVTARVETERELDDAQRLASVGSWVYYPTTGEMTWSREMFRMIGCDPDVHTASMDLFLAAIHPDDADGARQRQAGVSEITEAYESRYRVVLASGEIRHVLSRGRPEFDEAGAIFRLTGTLQDVTEMHLAAEKLAAVNGVLSDMMAMLSHDIRQPIHVMHGYLDMLRADLDEHPDPRQAMFIERAQRAARQMTSLTDDVLKLITIESGAMVANRDRVHLTRLVTDAVTDHGDDGGIEVDIRADVEVMVDAFHIRQVLGNLLTNAARYGAPPILVTIEADDARATVRVSDHGEGVPDDFVRHLFERFSRATTGVAATKSGTGFGLYIVNQLVRANDGEVAYSPVASGGSCFAVTLPLADAAMVSPGP
jgi:PAS domain S-box-containing protein